MAQQGTWNAKQTLSYPGNAGQTNSRKSKGYKERRNPNTCSREEAWREREKEKTTLEGLGPLIYWTLPFVGLHPYPFCLCLGGLTFAPNVHAPCVYIQRQKKHGSRQAKKETKKTKRACKEHTNNGGKQSILSIWKGKQVCYQAKWGVLGRQM